MLKKCHIGIYALLLLMSPLVQAATDCANADIPEPECDALVTLFNSTDGPNWAKKKGWNKTQTVCDWRGITCDATPNVTRISLYGLNLNGPIPSELEDLSELQILDLSQNLLTGEIPSELGNLSDLTHLDLADNSLTGSIPSELGGLSKLDELELSTNSLTGLIPKELGNLTSLSKLWLNDNKLYGEIPTELKNLGDPFFPFDLKLDYNHLTASDPALRMWLDRNNPGWEETQTQIPEPTICDKVTEIPPNECQALLVFYDSTAGDNWIDKTGWLETKKPCKWRGVSCRDGHVTTIKLEENNLNGTIPKELGQLKNLKNLTLNVNKLNGSIPSKLGTLSNLKYLRLDNNDLCGDIPAKLAKLENIISLELDNNHLTDPGNPALTAWLDEHNPDWADTQTPCIKSGALQFSSASYVVNEDDGSVNIVVIRVDGSEGEVSAKCSSSDDTATAGEDYDEVQEYELTWADGDTDEKVCPVNIIDDDDVEGDETFNLTLEAMGDASIGNPGTAVVTIVDNETPGTLEFFPSNYEVNEDGGLVTITVSRTGGSNGAISVDYVSSSDLPGYDNIATEGVDYKKATGTLNWADGDTDDKTFTVEIIDDSIIEGDEVFKLMLENVTGGATIGELDTARVVIVDNEGPGELQFSLATYDVNEEGGSVDITVSRVGASDGAVSVKYVTKNGSAEAWEDYDQVSGKLEWADGEADDKTITVNITDDSIFEGDETFELRLKKPTGGATIGDPGEAVVTIIDNDPQPPTGTLQFSMAEYEVNENDASVVITVTRVDGSYGAVSVDYSSSDDTATEGMDYNAVSGSLNWVDGETDDKTFTVGIINDTDSEIDETFKLTLENATGATIGVSGEAVVTIVDDEEPGVLQFSLDTYNVNENDNSIIITVKRVGGSEGAISVEYASSDDSAIVGEDYVEATGTLNWADGDTDDKTFTVDINDDSIPESGETFILTLANPTSGAELGDPITAVVTIVDDEVPGVLQFSKYKYKVDEAGRSVIATVKRIGGSDGIVSVSCISSDDTATAGDDYTKAKEILTWDDGDVSDKPCTVEILDDSLLEGKETFNLKLKKANGRATIGEPSTAEVTIVDDDSPGILQFTKATYQVNEAGGVVTIIVSRIGGSDGAASVKYASSDDTAKAGEDYTEAKGKLEWEDSDASNKSFTVAITDDSDLESDETFKLNLKNATGAELGEPNETVVTIIDNEEPNPGTLQFESATYDVDETGKKVKITVTRIGGTYGAVSVDYASSDNTATAGEDYVAATGTLKWKDGDNKTKKITVKITDDGNWEGNETFNLTLKNATGGATIGDPETAEVTITDDETPPESILQFSSATYSVDENGGSVEITVTRVNGTHGAISVQYASSDDTATVGEDYVEAKGELSWEDGDASEKTFTVNITDNTVLESDETFNLNLKKPKGATIGDPGEAVVTIVDNDVPGILKFSKAEYKVDEAGGSVIATVKRINGSDGAVSVKCISSDGTATDGEDYTAVSETLEWSDGDVSDKPCTVTILNDSNSEGKETFNLSLKKAKGGATIGDPSTAEVTIVDGDSPGILQFSKAKYKVNEASSSVTVIVNRIDGSDGAVSVDCVSSDGTAKAGEDYTAVSETLRWDDSDVSEKTCTTDIADDSILEGNETFNLKLENLTGGAKPGIPSEAEVTIVDGDSPGILQLSKANYEVNEAGRSVVITVSRVGGNDGKISVEYASSDDTTIAGDDYTPVSGKLKWKDDDASDKTFTVDIIDDSDFEGNEVFIVSLGNPTNDAELGIPNTAEVTIIDDEEPGLCMGVTEIPTLECEALIALYESTDGANWEENKDWNVTHTPCSWYGVECDGGHVIWLDLFSNDLYGEIPPELGNLTKLQYLHMCENELFGEIPTEFGNLSDLEYLWLSDNKLCGTIPEELMNTSIPAEKGYFRVEFNNLGTTVSDELRNWLDVREPSWEDTQEPAACLGSSVLQFSETTYTVNEGDGKTSVIKVERVDGSSGEVSVVCSTSDDTAKAKKDYKKTTNTLTWADQDTDAKTCKIKIIDDSKQEGDETFIVSLGEPDGGASLGTPDTAVVTINDND